MILRPAAAISAVLLAASACADGQNEAARSNNSVVPSPAAASATSIPGTPSLPVASAVPSSGPATQAPTAAGSNTEVRDGQGRTPLMVATHENRIDVARSLIQAGADVNAKDAISDTPYLYAAAEGRLEILELTLANGADLRDTNRFGGTGLIPAAHHGHVAVVRRLLATDIEVDHVNNLGWTALLEAVILGDGGRDHTEIVRLLLAAGANPNLADRDGVTPLQHAERRGYAEIAAALRSAGGR